MLRIWKNTLSRVLLLLLLILPSLEIIQYYIDENKNVKSGGVFHIPKPVYAIFQSAELTQGLLHSIFFWFLPLFLLLIVADDTLADIKTGYYNILVLKAGRKNTALKRLRRRFWFHSA